jgi:hypothetical protein
VIESCAALYTPRDLANQRRFNLWLAAAAVAYIGASAAVRWRASLPGPVPWLAIGGGVLLVLAAMRSYRTFLRDADELLRKVQTEALGLGFGAGALAAFFSPLVDRLAGLEMAAFSPALVMMVAWSAGAWLGTRRYAERADA